ncbi:MAG: hypothetical protein ACTSQA_05015 [Candidatus Heimdallarchaeaceae archaeon]
MKSIFIKEDEIVEVDIFFAKDKDGNMSLGNKKNELLEIKGMIEESLEEHKITLKYPSHGDMISIVGRSVRIEGNGLSVDPIAARSNRLIVLLRDWTFMDEDDKKLPITSDNINKLHPSVADFILDEFEAKVGII